MRAHADSVFGNIVAHSAGLSMDSSRRQGRARTRPFARAPPRTHIARASCHWHSLRLQAPAALSCKRARMSQWCDVWSMLHDVWAIAVGSTLAADQSPSGTLAP
eukprot:scaffold228731_cov33-Tisochrysis_lutea.AAC.1